VTQFAPSTLARFQSVASAAWPIVASKLEVKEKVQRCGFRIMIVRPTANQEEAEGLVKSTDLFRETDKWAEVFEVAPIGRTVAAVVGRKESTLRVVVEAVQHQIDNNAPRKLIEASPAHALRIDLDYWTDKNSMPSGQLEEFVRSNWIDARQLVRKIMSDV
jgi:hypothetical protein